MTQIRNFAIIAHIDAGKSTLADRLLELTGTIAKEKMRSQYLDNLFLERERGITIKMAPVRMTYRRPGDGADSAYTLNLIDTPGHVDFSYEVSRALAAVEGAVLLVDGTKGVQAQTLAHARTAREEGLVLIPAINKIDVPTLDLGRLVAQIQRILPVSEERVHLVSARTGEGVERLLEDIVSQVPAPRAAPGAQPASVARALVFDSHYDAYKGVILHVRVFNGAFATRARVTLAANRRQFEILELGYFVPELAAHDALHEGEIGYIATGLKDPSLVKIGDTVLGGEIQTGARIGEMVIPGYEEPKPMVFASFFPEDGKEYPKLQAALDQFRLFDPALRVEKDYSPVFGQGFELGFLGLLHMEIVKERLEREFGRDIFITMPMITYRIRAIGEAEGAARPVKNPNDIPADRTMRLQEPWLRISVFVPQEMKSIVLDLVREHRGEYERDTEIGDTLLIEGALPLRELISGFYDSLKSATSGYGSLDYELVGYRDADLAKLEVLIADRKEDALTQLVVRDDAQRTGKAVVEKLKRLLPKENFAVKLQTAVDGRIVARETIPALKKNVTGHLYGGDRTRKEKLWKKQKEGKKKLQEKGKGKISVSPSVVIELYKG